MKPFYLNLREQSLHTGICYIRITIVQHSILYNNNNTFYSIISKIRMNLPLIKFKGKNIIYRALGIF